MQAVYVREVSTTPRRRKTTPNNGTCKLKYICRAVNLVRFNRPRGKTVYTYIQWENPIFL